MHYNHNHTYDPHTGRFLTSDPLGLAPVPNPSTYPRNPTFWSDPLGLYPGNPTSNRPSAPGCAEPHDTGDRVPGPRVWATWPRGRWPMLPRPFLDGVDHPWWLAHSSQTTKTLVIKLISSRCSGTGAHGRGLPQA
ncbi:RHS repeat-associated core domain-containing protein [Nocardia sp. NPDC006982]|uniref:RHS repeat-associated core domain-containing protein n=1 Tax=Nocardia sp. NPDC006982 TaxID=3364307 RepID=UPI0036A3AF0F